MLLDNARADEVGRFLKGFLRWTGRPLKQVAHELDSLLHERHGEEAAKNLRRFISIARGSIGYLTQLQAEPREWEPIPREEVRFLAAAAGIPPLLLDPLFCETFGEQRRCLVHQIDEFEDVTEVGSRYYGHGARYGIPTQKLDTGTDTSLGLLTLDPVGTGGPSRSDYHDHPGTELLFLRTGREVELRLEASGVRLPFKKNDFVLFRAEMPHSVWNLSEESASILVIRFYQLSSNSTREKVREITRQAVAELKSYETAIKEIKSQARDKATDTAALERLREAARDLPGPIRVDHRRPQLDLPNYVHSLTHQVSSSRLEELRKRAPEQILDPVEDRFGLALLLDRLKGRRTIADLESCNFDALDPPVTDKRPFRQLFPIFHAQKELTLGDLEILSLQFGVEPMLLYPCMFPTEPNIIAGRINEMCQVPQRLTGKGATYWTPLCNLALCDTQLLIVDLEPGEATRWNHHPGYELALPLEGTSIEIEFGQHSDSMGETSESAVGAATREPSVVESAQVSDLKNQYAHYSSESPHRIRNLGSEKARVFVVRFYR